MHHFGRIKILFFIKIWVLSVSGANICTPSSSRQEFSKEYLVLFTCKNRLRYSRERAVWSLLIHLPTTPTGVISTAPSTARRTPRRAAATRTLSWAVSLAKLRLEGEWGALFSLACLPLPNALFGPRIVFYDTQNLFSNEKCSFGVPFQTRARKMQLSL